MDKFYLDLLICLLFAGGSALAIWSFAKKRFKTTIFSILLIGLVLRVYSASDPYLHPWDERYHALVAKNLMKHPTKPTLFDQPAFPTDDTDWIASHTWFSKPPVPLWSMSASIAVFGTNEYAVRIPSLLLGLVAIYITFLLGSRLFNERIGLIAAFLHAIHGLIIETAGGRVSSDHAETFFIILVELAIYFVVISLEGKKSNKWIFWAGICTGLAFLSKWFPALLVFPVWFIAFVFSEKFSWKNLFVQGLILSASCALVVVPWILNINSYGDNIINNVLFAFNEPIQGHEEPIYYYWHQIMIIFGEAIYIPIGFMVYFIIRKKKKLSNITLLAWIFIPMLAFTLGGTKRATYILIAAPAFFLITANLIIYALDNLKSPKQKGIQFLTIALLIGLPIRYATERMKFFYPKEELSDFYVYREVWEDKFNSKDVVFGIPQNIELMFYTDVRAAYPWFPTPDESADLQRAGFDIYFYYENGHDEKAKPTFELLPIPPNLLSSYGNSPDKPFQMPE